MTVFTHTAFTLRVYDKGTVAVRLFPPPVRVPTLGPFQLSCESAFFERHAERTVRSTRARAQNSPSDPRRQRHPLGAWSLSEAATRRGISSNIKLGRAGVGKGAEGSNVGQIQRAARGGQLLAAVVGAAGGSLLGRRAPHI